MINQDTIYWLWLADKCGVQSANFTRLIEKYDNPFDIYQLEEQEIYRMTELPHALLDKLCEKNLDKFYDMVKYCNQGGIDIISYGDIQYPCRLKLIPDPPIVLYCRGNFPDFDSRLCVGVVGTRKMSEYGRQSAYKITYELASSGVLTVSGMALGIDGVAASASLSAGGDTVAVLGCGVDYKYPKQHMKLKEEIIKHGAVISEYPPNTAPYGSNFPKRNRIISALCQATFVVEAAEESGALITASYCIAQGRDLFAMPGKITDAGAKGPNNLIRDGAYAAVCAEDIMKHYEFLYGDSANVKRIKHIDPTGADVDGIMEHYGLDYAIGGTAGKDTMYNARGGKRKQEARTAEKPSEKRAAAPVKGKSSNPDRSLGDSKILSEAYDNNDSAKFYEGLDGVSKYVFEKMPLDKPVLAEQLTDGKVGMAEVLTAFTILEVGGLVSSLPGGFFVKK